MFIDTVPEAAAAGALAEYYRQQRAAWGFLPNYAAAFSTRPDVADAWAILNRTVRDGMDRRRFEIATIAASRALRCTYCTAAHSTFLRDVCGDGETMRAIADEPSGTALGPQDRAVYEFAVRSRPMRRRSNRRTSTGSAPQGCRTPTSPTSSSPSPPGPSSRTSSTGWVLFSTPRRQPRSRRPNSTQ